MSEPTLYIKTLGKCDILIISPYVDDLIYTGTDEKMIQEFDEEQ